MMNFSPNLRLTVLIEEVLLGLGLGLPVSPHMCVLEDESLLVSLVV